MAVCLRLLTAAPRTRVQLEQALRRRAVPPETIEVVLDRLARARVIDDAMFAQMWVESRHYGRGLARRALTAELRQRGVGEDDLREAVDELSTEQEEAAARRMVAAKLPSSRGRPLPTRVRRLMSLLARKGYSPGLAYRVVREALEQEQADLGEDPAGGEAGMDLEAVLDAGQTLEEEQEADEDAAAFGAGDEGPLTGGPGTVVI